MSSAINFLKKIDGYTFAAALASLQQAAAKAGLHCFGFEQNDKPYSEGTLSELDEETLATFDTLDRQEVKQFLCVISEPGPLAYDSFTWLVNDPQYFRAIYINNLGKYDTDEELIFRLAVHYFAANLEDLFWYDGASDWCYTAQDIKQLCTMPYNPSWYTRKLVETIPVVVDADAEQTPEESAAAPQPADLDTLKAMLTSKWSEDLVISSERESPFSEGVYEIWCSIHKRYQVLLEYKDDACTIRLMTGRNHEALDQLTSEKIFTGPESMLPENIAHNLDALAKLLPQEVTYTPASPGPLSKEVSNTFQDGSYTQKILAEQTTLYRVHNDYKDKAKGYFTRTKPDLAIQSSTTPVAILAAPQGTVIYEGCAAAQVITGGIVFLTAGGNRYWTARQA